LEKEKDMECSDWGRADSIGIIIMVIGGLFLFILVLYIVRFGYKGAPTLLENVLVIVVPTILVILFIYRRISYREPNGKKPCIQDITPHEGVTLIYKNLRCKICERHPVSQKYHLKKVHNLRNVNVKDYFVCCGCVICIERRRPFVD
jgi:hypothetical protein